MGIFFLRMGPVSRIGATGCPLSAAMQIMKKKATSVPDKKTRNYTLPPPAGVLILDTFDP